MMNLHHLLEFEFMMKLLGIGELIALIVYFCFSRVRVFIAGNLWWNYLFLGKFQLCWEPNLSHVKVTQLYH